MKYFLLILCSVNLFLIAAPTAPSSQGTQDAIAATTSKEVMVISPQNRAQDFKEAFDYLKKIQTQSKITFTLKDHTKLSQVLDVLVMPGGTMLNFKINTVQGIQYQIIPIEDIRTISLQ
jgi:hypothetical protein